jgi:hypothetical protein
MTGVRVPTPGEREVTVLKPRPCPVRASRYGTPPTATGEYSLSPWARGRISSPRCYGPDWQSAGNSVRGLPALLLPSCPHCRFLVGWRLGSRRPRLAVFRVAELSGVRVADPCRSRRAVRVALIAEPRRFGLGVSCRSPAALPSCPVRASRRRRAVRRSHCRALPVTGFRASPSCPRLAGLILPARHPVIRRGYPASVHRDCRA